MQRRNQYNVNLKQLSTVQPSTILHSLLTNTKQAITYYYVRKSSELIFVNERKQAIKVSSNTVLLSPFC